MTFRPLQFDNWLDALGAMIGAGFLGAGVGGVAGVIGACLLVCVFTNPPGYEKKSVVPPTDGEEK